MSAPNLKRLSMKARTDKTDKQNQQTSLFCSLIRPLIIIFFIVLLFPGKAFTVPASGQNDFLVLCYHDVRDNVSGHSDPDDMAISTANLMAHFAWLKDHGYHPISIDQILDAWKGKEALPEKPILITFDDGLKSIYTRVYPVLKVFGFPAVVALVPSWIEPGEGMKLKYGSTELTGDAFMTWKEIRELDQTGLIEFVSHSYNLHRGILGNPQGNMQPAATTRLYDTVTKTYESDEAYVRRIRDDLTRSVAEIEKHLGKKPRVMCWPYGKYNYTAIGIAKELGMELNFTIEADINSIKNPVRINRMLLTRNPTVNSLLWMLRHPLRNDPENDPVRAARVKLDDLYAPSQLQRSRNLDRLLERIKRLNINTVYLQAFSDMNGDGKAEALYFPNRHLPVRHDLFNRVAWQLKTRAGVQVFAWMPVHTFQHSGVRLPLNENARQIILDIYEDLGKYSDFEGLFFNIDDQLHRIKIDKTNHKTNHWTKENLAFWGVLPDQVSDWELQSLQSLQSLTEQPGTKSGVTYDVISMKAMVAFTQELKEQVRKNRSLIVTAAYVSADRLMTPPGLVRVDDVYPFFPENFNYTVIKVAAKATAKSRGNTVPGKKWIRRLVKKARTMDSRLTRTVFEIQTIDPLTKRKVNSHRLRDLLELFQLQGGLSLGYYPEDFIDSHPNLKKIFRGISLQSYPYRKR